MQPPDSLLQRLTREEPSLASIRDLDHYKYRALSLQGMGTKWVESTKPSYDNFKIWRLALNQSVSDIFTQSMA